MNNTNQPALKLIKIYFELTLYIPIYKAFIFYTAHSLPPFPSCWHRLLVPIWILLNVKNGKKIGKKNKIKEKGERGNNKQQWRKKCKTSK